MEILNSIIGGTLMFLIELLHIFIKPLVIGGGLWLIALAVDDA